MRPPLFVALVSMLVLASCAPVDTSVALAEVNLDQLRGSWAGKMERRGEIRRLNFETPVSMEIAGGTPARAKFAVGTGTSWETKVEVSGGKVLLGFDQATRAFTLTRNAEGKLRLETSYVMEWQGWPQISRVVLEKK